MSLDVGVVRPLEGNDTKEYKIINSTIKDEWKPSVQVKIEAWGRHFVMNLNTSFTKLLPLCYFHRSTVCPSTLSARVALMTNGNSYLCFPPTLSPYSISSLYLKSVSLSLQNPSSCYLSRLPSKAHLSPRNTSGK